MSLSSLYIDKSSVYFKSKLYTALIDFLTYIISTLVQGFAFFTRGQYWPSGIVIAWVCVCVSTFFVRAITHLTFQLESSNLDQKIQQILLKVPIVFSVDWPWPSRSNLTSFQNYVYLHRFCILKYLWDLHKNGIFLNCCPAQMIPHICVYTDSNILADMVLPRTGKQSSCIFGETNAGSCFKSPPYHYVPGWLERRVTCVQSAVDSAIDTGFYKLLSVFAKLYTPHMPKLHVPTIGNCQDNSKTAPISLYFVTFDHGFVYISAISSMVNITGGYLICFTS